MNGSKAPFLVEAHRGDSSNAPENTMAAFERAVELGVDSIELDVHPAGDGTLMVIHDNSIDRTTDGSGKVGDMTVEELRRFDAGSWFAPCFAGQKIPLLHDVMTMLLPTEICLNIEIKSSAGGVKVSKAVVETLREFGKEEQYVVSSFNLNCLLEVREKAPEVTLALIGKGPEILSQARHYGFLWIHGRHNTLNEKIVSEAHANNLRVNAWTVDDLSSLPEWMEVGVDKLCTNRPAKVLEFMSGNPTWQDPPRKGYET